MTISRETLELAARACGIEGKWTAGSDGLLTLDGFWNPLTSAQDREQLAFAIGATACYGAGFLCVPGRKDKFFTKNDPTSLGIALCEAAAEVMRARDA